MNKWKKALFILAILLFVGNCWFSVQTYRANNMLHKSNLSMSVNPFNTYYYWINSVKLGIPTINNYSQTTMGVFDAILKADQDDDIDPEMKIKMASTIVGYLGYQSEKYPYRMREPIILSKVMANFGARYPETRASNYSNARDIMLWRVLSLSPTRPQQNANIGLLSADMLDFSTAYYYINRAINLNPETEMYKDYIDLIRKKQLYYQNAIN